MFNHLNRGKNRPNRSSTAASVPLRSSGRDSHNEWKCNPSTPSGHSSRSADRTPSRDVGLAGLYKSVSTVENSGFTRSPHDTPALRARSPKRPHCPNELNVI